MTYEYTYTEANTAQVGVSKALIPVSPEGEGWELVGGDAVSNTRIIYWWKRYTGDLNADLRVIELQDEVHRLKNQIEHKDLSIKELRDQHLAQAYRDLDEARRWARKLWKFWHNALAYAEKLADGLPEGMLPKDVELLRDGNAKMADQLESLGRVMRKTFGNQYVFQCRACGTVYAIEPPGAISLGTKFTHYCNDGSIAYPAYLVWPLDYGK